MGLIAAVLSGFALAGVAPFLYRVARAKASWTIAALPLGLFTFFASLAGRIAAGQPVTVSYAWVPTLDVNLSFRLDGLSLLFSLLITGIGALIVIYAGGYLAAHHHLGRFYAYLALFMASMLGLVLADNVITLFVFWELTSLSSYLLIGFDHEREAARSAALQALLVTGVGGLAMLAGLLLLGRAAGSLELSNVLGAGEAIRAHPLYLAILLLILAGAFTKSAQFPFHFWLPSAMEAPTPVSAYLHSATMVKAGVYLLARLSPVLGGTEAWIAIVTLTGAATMLVGAAKALLETDLKRILAYSTVSVLGMLTLLLGIGTPRAIEAAMVYLLAHALYKGALFLVAGAVDHETGTREATRLGGLRRAMPITAVAAAAAAVSMVGLPPLFGFIAKELLYEATWGAPDLALVITGVTVLSNTLLMAVAVVVGIQPFAGQAVSTPKKPHEAPWTLWLGPALLGGLGLIGGLFPQVAAHALVSPSGAALPRAPTTVYLSHGHGINPILGLSVITLAAGAALYARREVVKRLGMRLGASLRWGPEWWYDRALDALNLLALGQTRFLQNGYLRHYLVTIIVTTAGLVGYTLVDRAVLDRTVSWSDIRFYEAALAGLILLAALAAARSTSRLGAVAALGGVGFGVALIYLLFGAPDLAMTQFSIETLTVILFVLVFYHLPRFSLLSGRPARVRDALIALSFGALTTALVLLAKTMQLHPAISGYFVEHGVPKAHGRNIVNVILVDFRALDTLGEITVLAVVGIGVFALLKLRPENERTE